MPDLPTRLDYFRIGADEVLSRSAARPPGLRIAPKEVYTEGSDINIIIASASGMAEEVTRQMSLRINALRLDGARGEDLDRLVKDRFSTQVVRKGASPAVGTVFIERSVAGPAVSYPVGTKVKASDGTEFLLTVAAALPAYAGVAQSVSAPAEAATAGLTGNVAEDTITQFVLPTDASVTVNNPEVFAGGSTEETDASLRERARNFFLVARRGTLAAIEFGALRVPGVAQASGYEVVDMGGVPTGQVQLYISDLNGNANSALVDAVLTELLEWRAAGIPVQVFGTEPTYQDIVFDLQFRAGFDSNVVFAQVQNAVLSFVNLLPPSTGTADGPGVLREADLLALARGVDGTIVSEVRSATPALITPVGDVIAPAGQTIRTSLGRVTNT